MNIDYYKVYAEVLLNPYNSADNFFLMANI